MTPAALKTLALFAAIFYYGAFATECIKKVPKFIAYGLWGIGYLFNAVLVINNYLVNGYVPFVSIYQILTFLGICFLPIWLIMRFTRSSGWMARYFMISAAVVMTGLCFMDAESHFEFAPALQSVWFIPHILVYMISYTMGAVAFVLFIVSLFVKKEDKHRYELGMYDCVTVVFPFMTFGMFFGAIWANEIWGHFWSWDIKENFSLCTWLIFMLYLHFRRNQKLQKYAKFLVPLGFVGIIFTFLFANVFSTSSMHTYSM